MTLTKNFKKVMKATISIFRMFFVRISQNPTKLCARLFINKTIYKINKNMP